MPKVAVQFFPIEHIHTHTFFFFFFRTHYFFFLFQQAWIRLKCRRIDNKYYLSFGQCNCLQRKLFCTEYLASYNLFIHKIDTRRWLHATRCNYYTYLHNVHINIKKNTYVANQTVENYMIIIRFALTLSETLIFFKWTQTYFVDFVSTLW